MNAVVGLTPFVVASALAAAACVTDPVLEEQIAALGPEDPRIPIGPLHRPNQPCLVCHSPRGVSAGAARTIYSVAGTIYRDEFGKANGSGEPPAVLWPVEVTLTDSKCTDRTNEATCRAPFTVKSNCAGNFYIKPGDFDPVYPLWTDVSFGGDGKNMVSPVRGDGSCASCHMDPTGPQSVGHIYVLPFEPSGSNKDVYAAKPCPGGAAGM